MDTGRSGGLGGSRLLPAGIGHRFAHPATIGNWDEAESGVEGMGITGGEGPVAEGLQIGMGKEGVEHLLGDASAAMGFIDKDIAEVGEGGAIGDDASNADLGAAGVESGGDEGVGESAIDNIATDAGGPVGSGQPLMDQVHLEIGVVEGDAISVGGGHARIIRTYGETIRRRRRSRDGQDGRCRP